MATLLDMDTDTRWTAVQQRDKSFDGRFVYAVVTTGVFCRPSCAARLPRVENVRFFADNDAAAKAGFRACKRCKPTGASLADRQAQAVEQACRLIEAAEDRIDFAAIAAEVGISRYHFHRLFKDIAGLTPGAYAKATRARRALGEMADGASVTEAIYAAGYSSPSRFYEGVAPQLGVRPGSFAKGGAGETIRFGVGECSLGSILVAATAKGLCAIQFGDDPQALIDDLQRIFPRADLVGADAAFERWMAEVVGFVDAPARGLSLPLDVRGTAFQQKVWQALSEIPAGSTATYAEIAARIGAPGAVRAVANACAGNKLAVVIPCHRVVRTGGALSGYRWGVERKAALIAREAAA
ncbi:MULTISPECIES: bifunctional DNA-binding transcriptional regulator/O6-methylguanine-DNA methyltransferase Ada [Rhodomicrobium]|uniref:bifunctional DNA-binding transcriptional regulator/O6-methylguanine-DNA methyltransferase Ada n=1 Tax=Rhodomicrobium TaxID=1068 RepID=UPI000B4A7435|nr:MULTISPECIES: bifunctional DNA-binding transcriptional regulator/O6-methylguanine-DNA methyltransferase Ada [Rhodomicrobium]